MNSKFTARKKADTKDKLQQAQSRQSERTNSKKPAKTFIEPSNTKKPVQSNGSLNTNNRTPAYEGDLNGDRKVDNSDTAYANRRLYEDAVTANAQASININRNNNNKVDRNSATPASPATRTLNHPLRGRNDIAAE